jgi:glycosyltransferase involved in cell wall biosynthesis
MSLMPAPGCMSAQTNSHSLPRLSVIIPNYNHAHYLPTCLDAMLKQSVKPFEILIIEDASTDRSLEVISDYAHRYSLIRCHRNEKNQGVVFGMNRGLELAQGDYVYFAAADDEVLPGFFEKSLRLLSQYPASSMCCTIGDWREKSSGYQWNVAVGMADQAGFIGPDEMVRLEQQDRLYIASHTAIIRRAALTEVGGFIPELKWHCDWFAIYLAAFRYGICYLPEPLAVFNIHPTSFYTSGRKGDAHRQVILHMLELLNRPAFHDAAERVRISGALYQFAWPVLRAMLQNAAYRRFINPTFLRKNLWHAFKLQMKALLPAAVARWYFRTFYRARPAAR